jgi:hypothetical protein
VIQLAPIVAYEDRQGAFIFVAVPGQRGRYLRTDRSVILAACSRCGSKVGEPCTGPHGYGGSTHVVRRAAADRLVPRGYRAADLLLPFDEPPVPDEWMESSC